MDLWFTWVLSLGQRCGGEVGRQAAPPSALPKCPGHTHSLHGSHVVLWQQWDFQDFGVGEDGFMTGGGDGLARDPVDLVEGVGSQQAVVGRPDEQL